MSLLKLSASALAIVAASTLAASARDQLQIAGSSTVLPFATIVAEAFGEQGAVTKELERASTKEGEHSGSLIGLAM